jgi:hypothetical protein
MANLYVFHQGFDGNGQLWYSVFDGTNWGEDTQIQPLGMSGSPAAVAWAGGITVFHQGSDNKDSFGTRIHPMAQTGAQIRKFRT